MADVSTKWILNLVDKVTGPLKKMASQVEGTAKRFDGLAGSFDKIALKAIAFQQVNQTFSQLGDSIDQAINPGVNLQSSLKDLEAITGSTNEQLQVMETNARKLAKTYGGEASQGVEVYKLLLSQLGPSLADTPDVLNKMTENVFRLSKTMNGDTTGAVEVLTTAMNQYSVSLDNPIKAQEQLSLMMNAMSAGAKEGSAELPALKAAIQNVGGDAKRANLPFEVLVASIEQLDKSGKKGAEGGVALRNVLTTLSQGRFLPKDVQKELALAGVDINKLSDKSIGFTERLRELQKVSNDSALITKLFGKENQLAAAALIGNTDSIDKMTVAVTGTNTTVQQSETIMSSFSEKMGRLNAKFKDLGISLFNATEGFLPFVQGGIKGIGVLSQLAGAIEGVKLIMGGFWSSIMLVGRGLKWAGLQAFSFGKWVAISGFKALMASGRFILAALQGLGSFVLSLGSATVAQIGLNVAMTANPIGLIIVGIGAAIAAVVALVKYWDQITAVIWKFIKWIAKNNPFAWLIDIVDRIFPGFKQALKDFFSGIWDYLTGWASKLWEKMKAVWNSIKSLFGFGGDEEATITVKGDGEVTTDPKGEEVQETFQQKLERENALGASADANLFPESSIGSGAVSTVQQPTAAVGTTAGNAKSITMNLEITNHFTLSDNLDQKLEEIKEKMTQLFVDSGRDALVTLG
ncbi:MAG: phage tail tape measure protein [Flavobacteriales bacterium]|jgi:TP901 family phage tail tape measure protein|nr:phage tail tape measure protein [Flavobacteriales bacterium]